MPQILSNRKDLGFEDELFVCACSHPEHALIVSLDVQEPELYLHVQMSSYLRFFRRCWAALKYVLGLKRHGEHWDCFIFTPDEAVRMRDLMERFLSLDQNNEEPTE